MEKGQGKGTDTLKTDNVFTRKEYIEREAFITRQRELYCQNCDRRRGMKDGKLTKRFVYPIGGAPCRACDVDDMINAVEDYPAADVVPVRHAIWRYKTMTVPGGRGQTYAKWSCTACKAKQKERSNYCPNCGAKMDKDGDGE